MTHYTSKARVAGHLRDQVEVDRVKSGIQAHARRHRGVAARVPRAHHHIVFFREARNHDWEPRPERQKTILPRRGATRISP